MTSPILQQLLMTAIQEWFSGDLGTNVKLNQSNFPDDVRKVIEQQQMIGWHQIFNGRFGIECAVYQECYYSRRRSLDGGKQSLNGKSWQTNVISAYGREDSFCGRHGIKTPMEKLNTYDNG
jgi:hypothetical protein